MSSWQTTRGKPFRLDLGYETSSSTSGSNLDSRLKHPATVFTSSYCLHIQLLSSHPATVFTSSYCLHIQLLSSHPATIFTSSYCLHIQLLSSHPATVFTSSYCTHPATVHIQLKQTPLSHPLALLD
ncbi:hypothetical protein L211DRAFT_837856 [Terfezia boudieri ATCC MYA-4762]|uniref:Uncharacterized protein n=1 Tax=Terfezia boudieri ATCC MYA-4762 TaxID=1051890 RepID=A0A3N4LQN5_9PEZI|nr:hypothetical protein L211DRAFT_837856 [Terfezia boudieri ATCC MYA-4762]